MLARRPSLKPAVSACAIRVCAALSPRSTNSVTLSPLIEPCLDMPCYHHRLHDLRVSLERVGPCRQRSVTIPRYLAFIGCLWPGLSLNARGRAAFIACSAFHHERNGHHHVAAPRKSSGPSLMPFSTHVAPPSAIWPVAVSISRRGDGCESAHRWSTNFLRNMPRAMVMGERHACQTRNHLRIVPFVPVLNSEDPQVLVGRAMETVKCGMPFGGRGVGR